MNYQWQVGWLLSYPVKWFSVQFVKPSVLLQYILWPSSYECRDNFDFSSRHCITLYFCFLIRISEALHSFHRSNICHNHTDYCTHIASFTGHIYQVQFSSVAHRTCVQSWKLSQHWSGSHCIDFFWNIPNVRDNDRAMTYSVWRRANAFPWLHKGINELLWVFIKYRIMFYSMFLISVLKSFRSWHMTLALLASVWLLYSCDSVVRRKL
jgi:hypothetical protein